MRIRFGAMARYLPAAAALVVAVSAQAQVSGGPVDLQLFRPAMDSKGYVTLNGSQVLGHLDPSFGLIFNYARRPLSMASDTTGNIWCRDPSTPGALCATEDRQKSRYQVLNLATGHLQAAVGLFGFGELGIGVPFTLWNGDTSPDPSAQDDGGIDAQGIGDLSINLKGRLLNTSIHPLGLSIVTTISLPTGSEDKFLGSDRVGIYPSTVAEKEFFRGRLRTGLNVGARFRLDGSRTWTDDDRVCELQDGSGTANCSTGRAIETEHDLTYGAGVAVGLIPQRLEAVAEIFGQTGLSDPYDSDKLNSAHEILAGLKLYLATNSYLAFGASRGLRGGGDNYQYGSPDVRAFLAFIFEPAIGDIDGDGIKDDVDKCPTEPEDFDGFEDQDGCPDPDNDQDGILDVDDKCPNDPEDKDGVEDEDGCPESEIRDRDGDGIPDDRDNCPDDPEDIDGFEDEDGCPDPDNDQDGILDVDDLCPNEPEDKDGFEDQDGCPDPDNDRDRILDRDDRCPNEPETYNGYEDEDGCPDKGSVIVHKGKIEILDKIYFETNKAIIKPVSYPILNAVAATLKGNPDIGLVEIQGHADERGADAYNLDLTERRAQAVREYLIEHGVEPDRLEAKGYGERRPVDRRHNEEAWAKNRRSEFIILRRGN